MKYKKIIGYKFVKQDMTSKEGNHKWQIGKWYTHNGELRLCDSGFHACRTPSQSLGYVYGDRWFKVEARGKIVEKKGDKFVASEMRLVSKLPIKPTLPLFAVACAKRCLPRYEKKYPDDNCPRKAIEAAENYIRKPTTKNMVAAESAARSAARSTAESARSAARSTAESAQSAAWSAQSARSAAWSASRSTAQSAAQSAAESAAWSARSAAWSAAWSAQSAWSAAESAAESARSTERRWQDRKLKEFLKEAQK